MSVEMTALVFPVTVIMSILLVGTWQLSAARLDVHAAAAAAARAASQQATPSAAVTAANDMAEAALTDAGRTCAQRSVDVDTSDFGRGGSVTVIITCRIVTGDLVGLDAPGTVPTTASARSPIETFRDISPEEP